MNAFLPQKMKNSILGKDYQKIANDVRDNGMILYWNNGYPSLDIKGLCNMSYLFFYQNMINPIITLSKEIKYKSRIEKWLKYYNNHFAGRLK